MKINRILSQIALVTGTLLFSLGIQTYAQTWSAPTVSPPNSNAYTPLTIGPAAQIKAGGLLLSTGNAVNGLLVQNGNVGIGTISPTAKLDVAGNLRVAGEVKIGNSGAACTTANLGSVRYAPAPIDAVQYCASSGGTPVWKHISPPPPLTISAIGQCPNPNPNGGGNNCPPSNVGGAAASATRLCVLAGRSNYLSTTNQTIAGNIVGGAYWNGSRWVSTSWGGGQVTSSIVCQ